MSDEAFLSARMREVQHNQKTRHVARLQDDCAECQAIRYAAYRERHPIDKWVAKHLGIEAP